MLILMEKWDLTNRSILVSYMNTLGVKICI